MNVICLQEVGLVEVQLHSVLTQALDGGECSPLRRGRVTAGETVPVRQ